MANTVTVMWRTTTVSTYKRTFDLSDLAADDIEELAGRYIEGVDAISDSEEDAYETSSYPANREVIDIDWRDSGLPMVPGCCGNGVDKCEQHGAA